LFGKRIDVEERMKRNRIMKSRNKLLWALPLLMLLVSTTLVEILILVNVTLASPATYIYATPAVITDKVIGNTFAVDMNVSEAPDTFAWEVLVSWDPNALELFYKLEGEFLKRPPTNYQTTFTTYPTTPPWDQANVKGEITVGCTLNNPLDPWANGTGRLFRLGFRVKANGSTLINLFDTVLLDHIEAGAPAPTVYSNNDSFFYNVNPSHDISGRARYITPLNTSVHVGEIAKINVTVLNEGTVSESITLNVYANDTLIGTTGLSLNGTGNFENRSRTYTVNWNTTGFALGRYNISATVPAVTGEVDTADNTYMGEKQVTILPIADIDHDGTVNVDDLTSLVQVYGTTSTSSNWNPSADLNKDSKIDAEDIFLLGRDYGKTI